MQVHRAIAEELVEQGVSHVFGLLGEDVARSMVAAHELGIEFVSARHENQAVSMADTYARTTGRVGVVALAGGPGFTNALTALNTANRFGSRLVVLIGGGQPGAKQLAHTALCQALGVTSLTPSRPEDVVAELGRALWEAGRDRPVVLEVPVGHLDVDLDGEPRRFVGVAESPVAPDPEGVARIAELLTAGWAAARPVVLAGRGAMRSQAVPVLRELGELTGALLATTLRAHAAFTGDPFDLGTAGTYARPSTSELLGSADCVLAFGASLNRFTTLDATLFPKARLVQIDADPAAIGRHLPVDEDLSLVGDARSTAEALVAELASRGHRSRGWRTDEVRRRCADTEVVFTDRSAPDALDPRTIAVRLDEALPDDRAVVIDGAHSSAFAVPHLRVPAPERFVQTSYVGGASAIGLSLGAAIGAAVANPGVPVVNWMGDASHLMSLGDVDTAVRHRLPIVLVVCNDRALGAEVKFLELAGMPTELAQLDTPPFAEVAVAMGAEGHTVRTLGDLDAVASRLAGPLTGPVVLDCRVDPAVRADWVDFLWAPGGG